MTHLVHHNWSPIDWSLWTNGPQPIQSPWTNCPQKIGRHGQMVPNQFGPHGQMVPRIGAVHKGCPQFLGGEGVPNCRRLPTLGGRGLRNADVYIFKKITTRVVKLGLRYWISLIFLIHWILQEVCNFCKLESPFLFNNFWIVVALKLLCSLISVLLTNYILTSVLATRSLFGSK